MASSFVPVDNMRNGFTIVTQVVPGGTEQYGVGTGGGDSTQGPLSKLLKGEPKALGTVQIMIGIVTILFGIVKTVYIPSVGAFSGVFYWGSCLYIASGALSVAAGKKATRCLVTSSLIMNAIIAMVAGIAIILLSTDIVTQLERSFHDVCSNTDYQRDSYSVLYENRILCEATILLRGQSVGVSGVLLVFAVLEFIICICTSSFACKAICSTGATATIHLYSPEGRNLEEHV